MDSTSGTSGCAPLVDACTLELYQRNIFRITGLPVDATPKEVSRQAQKLQMMDEMGGGAMGNTTAFAATPPPTSEQVREALARMKVPEQRLVDELFWYWPQEFGQSSTDPAIKALLRGDGQEAANLWVDGENAGSVVARHNLAVMFHMYAVDWTNHHVSYDLDEGRDEKIKGYWHDALSRWEELAEEDELWEILKKRVTSLGDEALTTGFVRRMRRTLPQALDRVNAEAALKFAEQGRMDWASYHVDAMRQSHAGQDDVERTAELVLEPTRKRLEQHLSAARLELEKNPKLGSQLASDLLVRCEPLKDIYDLFHGPEGHLRNDLFDQVAKTVVDLLVGYQRATGDNSVFVELLQKALGFATGTHIRERLLNNINIGESNLAGEKAAPVFASMREITESGANPAVQLERVKTQVLVQLPALASNIGATTAVYGEVMDAIALGIRGIAIDAHNKHEDFPTAEAAIQLALKLVVGAENRERIMSDIAALAANKQSATCYFCSTRPASKESVFELAMHGNVVRTGGKVYYDKINVRIPCCPTCKSSRSSAETTGCVLWIIAIVIGIIVGAANGKDAWIGGGFIGLGVGYVISKIVEAIMKSSAGLKNPAQHPDVKKMLAQGWAVGVQPS